MRAAVCPEYGPPEVVRVEETAAPARPTPPGQARVRIAVAAVNYPDVLLVADRYQVSVAPPFVPGSEFAGIIDEIGGGVDGFAVGDRVMGTAMVGAFAEEAMVPVAALRAVPVGMELATAAAFGVAHRTAYHALRSVAGLQPGEELVVLGAGGGVGLAAVQLGRELGATVTAVASSADKLAVAQACGATNLIEHTSQDLRQALRTSRPDGADVVIDPVGGRLSEPALRALRFGGRFVTIGYASGEISRIPLNLVLLKGIQVHGFQFLEFVRHRPDQFQRNETELMALLAAGRATPHIGATYTLDDAPAALRCVADGRAIGKVVITVP